MSKHAGPLADRFWSHVAKSDGCWLWTAALNGRAGYGKSYVAGHYIGAHRIAWALTYGPILPGRDILHRCDNPPCVRPDHLFLGDALVNARDRISKGRPGSPGPKVSSRGEGRWSAKLTSEQVAELRLRYTAGGITQRELAAEYGVGQVQISRIVRGQRWK
jgi:hypothetical protein